MRILICILFAVAWQLHGQGEVSGPEGSYAGQIPPRVREKIIFRASVGEFTNGPVKMELIGRDAETDEVVISFLVPAVEKRHRIIKAEFPFGGRYTGRYKVDRNVIVGHFFHFSRRGDVKVPRRSFEMTPLNTNLVQVASPPAH